MKSSNSAERLRAAGAGFVVPERIDGAGEICKVLRCSRTTLDKYRRIVADAAPVGIGPTGCLYAYRDELVAWMARRWPRIAPAAQRNTDVTHVTLRSNEAARAPGPRRTGPDAADMGGAVPTIASSVTVVTPTVTRAPGM